MSKVVVVTSSRADYWLLRPLMEKLRALGKLELVISGMNLDPQMQAQIHKDGFVIAQSVECTIKQDLHLEVAHAISRGVASFAQVFTKINPELIVLLGDRYEIFAAAIAAYTIGIPIAHIHGGEVTAGALDEGYRHSISKMSHMHFVSHEEYKKRLMRMGEHPANVHLVGAIGLDHLSHVDFSQEPALFNLYPQLRTNDYVLLTLHSSTLVKEDSAASAECIIEALNAFPELSVIITSANNDPGGSIINAKWKEWHSKRANVILAPTLGDDYLKIAKRAKLTLGNSSSGILEIPYLNCPVINIGLRQKGRILPTGVYQCDFDVVQLQETIRKVMFEHKHSHKIYGEPGTISEKIIQVIKQIDSNQLQYKEFFDAQ